MHTYCSIVVTMDTNALSYSQLYLVSKDTREKLRL